jgi:hypothetical protein
MPLTIGEVAEIRRLLALRVEKGRESSEVPALAEAHAPEVAKRAEKRGVRSLPAVPVDGQPAICWAGRGPDERSLREALR